MSQALLERYDERIAGVLSCYDRAVITPTLPGVCCADGMTRFLHANGVCIFDYQGLYNAITRAVEPELFKCLGNYGIRFHAYNPLAGGAFSKNFAGSAAVAAGSRFDSSTAQGKFYRDRYWNDAYLDALAEIHRSCEGHGRDAISVALRWLIHHSQLNAERNDGVIIGASSLEHLRHNLTAVTEGPLPTEVLAVIDDAALKAQPKWPPYFSGV